MTLSKNNPSTDHVIDTDAPLSNFSHCHVGILNHLDRLIELPALLGPAALARKIAQQSVAFFHHGMLAHHQEEEKELFPAVHASAQKGQELAHVDHLIARLVEDHRALELLWSELEPALKKVAHGQDDQLDPFTLQVLVSRYTAHAQLEEQEFLPLAEIILGRNSNHMAALGLSLHMRHAPAIVGHL